MLEQEHWQELSRGSCSEILNDDLYSDNIKHFHCTLPYHF